MDLVPLADGVVIPALGMGTWALEGKKCIKAVRAALDIGYRHIDTASAYGNEAEVAQGMADFPRKDLFLTTKLWHDVQDPHLVETACDASLKKLATDTIDLYLLHWPKYNTVVEILQMMHQLKKKGKVRSVGICNATIRHLDKISSAGIEVSMNQVEFHPFFYQRELLEYCQKHRIAMTAYRPLAKGAVDKNKTLKEIGQRHGKTAAQTTLRWLRQKGIIPIPKSASKERLAENFDIFDFRLSPEEMLAIDGLDEQRREVRLDVNEFDL